MTEKKTFSYSVLRRQKKTQKKSFCMKTVKVKIFKEDNLVVQLAIHVLTCSRNPFDSPLSFIQGIFPSVGYIDKVSLKSKHADILTLVNSLTLLGMDGNDFLIKLDLV